jgi:hypothetical protein
MSCFPTIARNQKRIRDKIRYVLNTYLQPAIDQYNLDTDAGPYDELEFPRGIFIGTPVADIDPQAVDSYPILALYPERSDNIQDDLVNAQTQQAQWTIVASALDDGSSLDRTTEQSSAYINIAAQILENYLPDPPGVASNTIWRVDVINTTSRTPQRIPGSENSFWFIATYATIQISVRSAMGWEPTFMPESVPLAPFVESNFYLSGSSVFGYTSGSSDVDLVTGTQNSIVEASMPASITGSIQTYLDMGATNIPSTSTYTILAQRDNSVHSGTLSGSKVPLAPSAISSNIRTGDLWNYIIKHPTTDNLMMFSVRWTLT